MNICIKYSQGCNQHPSTFSVICRPIYGNGCSDRSIPHFHFVHSDSCTVFTVVKKKQTNKQQQQRQQQKDMKMALDKSIADLSIH